MDIRGDKWRVMAGSCLERLRELPDCSVDAVVTDPPYGLSNTDPGHVVEALTAWASGDREFIPSGKGFMGKAWDAFVPPPAVWDECLRVLKPGGHLLAFAGSRTFDLMALSIRLAGFEIRDSVAWLYGSGFPKSLDVSKAVDKANGVAREPDKYSGPNDLNAVYGSGMGGGITLAKGAPATAEAEKWQGWGTALKPAFEPVVVARKPLIGTVAENVLAYGTGGLNIDGTRIGTEERVNNLTGGREGTVTAGGSHGGEKGGYNFGSGKISVVQGRWPSNVMLDEFTAGLLDEQSGVSKSASSNRGDGSSMGYQGGNGTTRTQDWYSDSGGASRFFYIAKASKRDRNEGLDELPERESSVGHGRDPKSAGAKNARAGIGSGSATADGNAARKNFHPTVKPTDLMRQLIRLVTPPGGIVLDPFTGSGSTGKAAILEGFEFIGCELTDEYLPIIEGRLSHAVSMAEESAREAEAREAETLF